MNILITDYYCASNRGDAAILEGVHQSLKEVYPNADITVMTEHPRAAELVHGIDAEKQTLAAFRWNLSKKNAARMYLSLTAPLYNRNLTPPGFQYVSKRANIQPYLDADLVVSTGGQFLTDIYFPSKIGVLWQHYFLSQLDTPFVIYAQTLGPFNRSPYRKLTKEVLTKADLILTRDRLSKVNVEELGVTTPIHFTADAAFSMDLEKDEDDAPINYLKSNDNIPTDGEKTVSMSVREWGYTDRNVSVDDYALAIAEVADWLISTQNSNVVFASTCTGLAGYSNDDRLMAAQIVDLMEHGEDDGVQILAGEYTPQQLVDIYSKMDLHIGMRMHSDILAMMAETPVVAIQYQFKTEGLMEMFDLLDYMIDVNDIDQDSLQQVVRRALNNRSKIGDKIASKLPTIRERSHKSAQLTREIVSDY